MPTITFAIGTSSRDYSTITLWEADLDDDTPYDAGDDALGEGYNDSAFDEATTINGGGTLGLNSVTLSVAAAERHDGTAGSGTRIVRSTTSAVLIDCTGTVQRAVDWWEFDANGQSVSGLINIPNSQDAIVNIRRTLGHGFSRSGATTGYAIADTNLAGGPNILNNIVYDLATPGGNHNCSGISTNDFSGASNISNNTVDNIVGSGSGNAIGIAVRDRAGNTAQNNVATRPSTGTGSALCFGANTASTMDHNASSDTTATGTASLTEIVTADQFVSVTGGSEDYHLKTGADCIDAGADLATTPTGVNIDIDGRDRDAEADTWDIGADEFVAAAGGGTIAPTGIASGEAFGAAQLNGQIAASAAHAGETVGSHQLNAAIAATAAHAGETVGSHTVSGVDILATGIASAEAFGVADLDAILAALGIASGEVFGLGQLNAVIFADPAWTGESFGSHTLPTVIDQDGIISRIPARSTIHRLPIRDTIARMPARSTIHRMRPRE